MRARKTDLFPKSIMLDDQITLKTAGTNPNKSHAISMTPIHVSLKLKDIPAKRRFYRINFNFGSISAIYLTDMRWSKVGIMEKLAKERYFQQAEQWSMTVAMHETAVKLMPTSENHYLALAKLLVDRASMAKDSEERASLFQKADRVLEAGGKLKPLVAAFPIRRGHLYRKWAGTETAQDRKLSLGKQAVAQYRKAAALDPGNFALWNAKGHVELVLLGLPDEARDSLLRSLELQPNSHSAHGLLGSLFFQKASDSQSSTLKQAHYRSALTNFQKAIVLAGTNLPDEVYSYTVNLGALHANLGESSQAIAAYENALPITPPPERWRNEEILARLYADVKNKTNSLEHMRRAIELAPATQQPNLIKLKDEILARP